MDYDNTDIPVVYDRGRDHGPEVLQLWMDVVASCVAEQHINTILDLGCGTGRFSEALATHFDAQVIGIDPSTKMLDQARKKQRDSGVRYESGCGEAIPLDDDSVDLVFMSMSFHHFEDPTAAARECRRVLPVGATAFLRAGIRDRISSYPYVDFFPASRTILEERLPTAAFIREVFESAGFSTVSSQVITQQIGTSLAAYADKVSAGADSVLTQLTRHDFQEGIAAMRLYAKRIANEPVYEPIDVFVFR